jgi:hypothetical protein
MSDPRDRGRFVATWLVKKVGVPFTSKNRTVYGIPAVDIQAYSRKALSRVLTEDAFTGSVPESKVEVAMLFPATRHIEPGKVLVAMRLEDWTTFFEAWIEKTEPRLTMKEE